MKTKVTLWVLKNQFREFNTCFTHNKWKSKTHKTRLLQFLESLDTIKNVHFDTINKHSKWKLKVGNFQFGIVETYASAFPCAFDTFLTKKPVTTVSAHITRTFSRVLFHLGGVFEGAFQTGVLDWTLFRNYHTWSDRHYYHNRVSLYGHHNVPFGRNPFHKLCNEI